MVDAVVVVGVVVVVGAVVVLVCFGSERKSKEMNIHCS